MKILAFETSGMSGSVAVWTGEETVKPRQWDLPSDQRNARSLAPAIQMALAEMGWKAGDLELIGVTNGPGSFTGLRVGVVMAKGLGFALGCPVIGVNTLEVIARQAPMFYAQSITAVMDAQRSELFSARHSGKEHSGSNDDRESVTTNPIESQAWLADLKPGTIVTGPGLMKLVERIPSSVHVVGETHWQPQAATVAQLAWETYSASKDRSEYDPFKLMPLYFRRTAAEEQWERKQASRAV
jgi:tRNA threonylcarbamoyladenosine biosynthesis protein TsaB